MVKKVKITGSNGTFKVTLDGSGFGAPPVELPCPNCNIIELQIWTLAPPANQFGTITTWSDTKITITGVGGAAGQPLFFAVTDDQTGTRGTGSGKIPGGSARPVIKSVTFSGYGASLQITVLGQGFGPAPSGVPGTTDLAYFEFADWVNGYPWTAGYTNGMSSDTVTLNYTSWSNKKIVISGFGGAYGSDGFTVNSGDAIAVAVDQVQTGTSNPGPQAGKTSVIP
jgi:hypothetical protein